MLRRVIDLTLPTAPSSPPATLKDGPLPVHLELSGPERSAKAIQRLFRFIPYAFETNEIGADIYLGDSLPHTHAEALVLNEVTVLERMPLHQRWAVRDIASIPVQEFTGEAAVVDISDLDSTEPYPLPAVQERARHLCFGDFLLLRTDYGRQQSAGSGPYHPGLSMAVARWFVEHMGITGIMADTPVDNSRLPEGVHTYLYQNAVLMIDNAVNFAGLPAARVFLAGGLTLKTLGIGSCPARPVAYPNPEQPLGQSRPIDLFQEIPIGGAGGQPLRIDRREPYELQAEIFKRYQIFPVQIAGQRADEQRKQSDVSVRARRDFGSPIRLFNSRLGTYIQQPYVLAADIDGATLELTRSRPLPSASLAGPALRVDLTGVGPRQLVTRRLLQEKAGQLRADDAVLLWTGFSDRFYQRSDYLRWSPRFALDAIEWLVAQGVRLIATDATTLEEWPWETPAERQAESVCLSRGIPVVLAATNLWLLERDRCFIICSPVPLDGFPVVPARLVAVEEYQ